MTAAGIVVIALLPLALHRRLLAVLVWTLVTGREVWALAKAYQRCERIRLDAQGGVELLLYTGDWITARLLPGSVVLANLAWLRFSAPETGRFAELVRGNLPENEAWRRFQVIWRHLGGAT